MPVRQAPAEIRQRLFKAATRAFVRDGFEGASLNVILAGAKIGKSSFFYYFLDKEDLFASILEAAVARVADAAGPWDLPDSATDYWQSAAAVLERWSAAASAEPGFVDLLRALQPLRRTASPRLNHVLDAVQKGCRSLLTRGVKLGVVRDDISVDTMMALIEVIDLVLNDELFRSPKPNKASIDVHRSRVTDIVQRIIRK
jgi:AcrR family transcriptional regulator